VNEATTTANQSASATANEATTTVKQSK